MFTGEEIKQMTNGTIFSATFTKKDGTERKMVARLGVTAKLKGGKQSCNPTTHGLLTVYDMQAKGYRNINLNTLKRLKVRGNVYTF